MTGREGGVGRQGVAVRTILVTMVLPLCLCTSSQRPGVPPTDTPSFFAALQPRGSQYPFPPNSNLFLLQHIHVSEHPTPWPLNCSPSTPRTLSTAPHIPHSQGHDLVTTQGCSTQIP